VLILTLDTPPLVTKEGWLGNLRRFLLEIISKGMVRYLVLPLAIVSPLISIIIYTYILNYYNIHTNLNCCVMDIASTQETVPVLLSLIAYLSGFCTLVWEKTYQPHHMICSEA